MYFCVGQSSTKMSAMRIRHKKLSCVLTDRERNLLKETKEVRERNLALLKELRDTKNKLYAFQQEMRQKGCCGINAHIINFVVNAHFFKFHHTATFYQLLHFINALDISSHPLYRLKCALIKRLIMCAC